MVLTIGVAICCYKGHLPHLKRLFDSIERQTRKPDQVVISCSSTVLEDVVYRRSMYSFPFTFVIHKEKKNAAQNRNTAAEFLNTDIVSFFDADDIMHPQRLSIIADCFEKQDTHIVLHNIELGTSLDFTMYQNVYLYLNQLDRCEWGSTILRYPAVETPIANGHVSVRRVVLSHTRFEESEEFQGREDTKFSTDVIRRHPFQTAYCQNILSRYDPSGTGGFRT
uniref:Glycosyltransferase 2-like domain-containing protein n=1 Tax=viral metagenome TaxID=1070528 RepID=A0A6C0DFL1_9ZZZZ